MRDFGPAYDSCGSIATEMVLATLPLVSGSPRKQT